MNLNYLNTIGMNGIKLIFDPESQKLYQQQSNGTMVLSDMQFANASQSMDAQPMSNHQSQQ